jgi:hypothetical protein
MVRLPSLYGFYKEHLACFRCRKMFKRTSWSDLTAREQAKYDGPLGYLASLRCPACGGPVRDMGKGFRPPRKSDVKAWRELERSGELFPGWHNRW